MNELLSTITPNPLTKSVLLLVLIISIFTKATAHPAKLGPCKHQDVFKQQAINNAPHCQQLLTAQAGQYSAASSLD